MLSISAPKCVLPREALEPGPGANLTSNDNLLLANLETL